MQLRKKHALVWEGSGYPRNGASMGMSISVTMPCHHMAAVAVNGLTAYINGSWQLSKYER